MADKKSFVMYENWAILMANLPDEQAGLLIKAICAYQIGKEYEITDPTVQAMFAMILPKMREDADSYAETKSKRAYAARAKWENAEKKNANAKSKVQMDASAIQNDANAENEMQMHGDTDTVTDTVTDTDTVTETEKDTERKKTSKKRAATSAYTGEPELDEAIAGFVEQRKKLRKPMTDKAIELFIARVQKLAPTVSEQVSLIDTAIERGWQTVYPVRDAPKRPTTENALDDHLLEIINGGSYDDTGGF